MSVAGGLPYVCPTCGRSSWHPEDLRHGYCPLCGFETDPLGLRQARVAAGLRLSTSPPPPDFG
jgi:hypothetical protein